MEIRQITPADAHDILVADPNVVYLDVRTAEEFEQGHPRGAWNVPVVFRDAGGGPAKPNPDFLAVVEQHIARNRSLLVGCQSGGRSQRACTILSEAGYGDVANVQGGFGGARDRAGQLVVVGWRDAGLPVDSGQPAGRGYADLSTGP